jgi:hypothetical protein
VKINYIFFIPASTSNSTFKSMLELMIGSSRNSIIFSMPRRTQPPQLRVVQVSIVVPCPSFLSKSITPPMTALSNTHKFHSKFWDSGEQLYFSYLLSMHLTTVPLLSCLRGQLNPASPCIPDTLFFPSQPAKAVCCYACMILHCNLSNMYFLHPARIGAVVCDGSTPAAAIFSIPRRPASKVYLRRWHVFLTSNFGNDVPWPPPPGLERQYKMSYSSQ